MTAELRSTRADRDAQRAAKEDLMMRLAKEKAAGAAEKQRRLVETGVMTSALKLEEAEHREAGATAFKLRDDLARVEARYAQLQKESSAPADG